MTRERLEAQLAQAEKIGDHAAAVMLRARLAADVPAYAGTPEGQEALHTWADLVRRARTRTLGPETSGGYRADMAAAGRGRMVAG